MSLLLTDRSSKNIKNFASMVMNNIQESNTKWNKFNLTPLEEMVLSGNFDPDDPSSMGAFIQTLMDVNNGIGTSSVFKDFGAENGGNLLDYSSIDPKQYSESFYKTYNKNGYEEAQKNGTLEDFYNNFWESFSTKMEKAFTIMQDQLMEQTDRQRFRTFNSFAEREKYEGADKPMRAGSFAKYNLLMNELKSNITGKGFKKKVNAYNKARKLYHNKRSDENLDNLIKRSNDLLLPSGDFNSEDMETIDN